MKLHRQSAKQLKFSEQGNLLGVFDRKQHMALEVACPGCEASATVPCRVNGAHLSPLMVHHERMVAFL